MQDGGEENTYEYATLSSKELAIYNGCVALPQLRKTVGSLTGAKNKSKRQKVVDYDLDEETPLGIRIGFPSFQSKAKPTFSDSDASSLYILNDSKLKVSSKLSDVIGVISSYLDHFESALQKPTSAQMKPSFGITNLPEDVLTGHSSIPDDVIFVPTDGSNAIATYCGGNVKVKKSSKKLYDDTHNNSLLGRGHSHLTMIKDDVEWEKAKSNNLICFSRDARFINKSFDSKIIQ